MKSILREKWQPSERVYVLLESKGIPREWVGHQIGEFKLYWLDAGLKKSSWDSTFNNWCKKNWQTVDKRRMYHEKTQPTIPKPPNLTIVTAKPELSQEERITLADKYLADLFK